MFRAAGWKMQDPICCWTHHQPKRRHRCRLYKHWYHLVQISRCLWVYGADMWWWNYNVILTRVLVAGWSFSSLRIPMYSVLTSWPMTKHDSWADCGRKGDQMCLWLNWKWGKIKCGGVKSQAIYSKPFQMMIGCFVGWCVDACTAMQSCRTDCKRSVLCGSLLRLTSSYKQNCNDVNKKQVSRCKPVVLSLKHVTHMSCLPQKLCKNAEEKGKKKSFFKIFSDFCSLKMMTWRHKIFSNHFINWSIKSVWPKMWTICCCFFHYIFQKRYIFVFFPDIWIMLKKKKT